MSSVCGCELMFQLKTLVGKASYQLHTHEKTFLNHMHTVDELLRGDSKSVLIKGLSYDLFFSRKKVWLACN